jgi:aspartyl-tRNA(Asn)/glutamyl-tRNA(Gln) amidotransferase subunit C
MAQITRDDVLKLAQLSRIKLSDEEVDKFVKELGEIVKYVEQIDELDVEGLKPTDQVTGLVNVTRPDEPVNYGASPDELLKNAPSVVDKQIKVKRIIQ